MACERFKWLVYLMILQLEN